MNVSLTTLTIKDSKFHIHLTRQPQQALIIITSQEAKAMDSLAFAVSTPYDKLPTVIDIVGAQNELALTLARSLCKKFGIQIFLNYNHALELDEEIFNCLTQKLSELI